MLLTVVNVHPFSMMLHVVSCPTLLPVQPPEVDTLTLPLPHHNSQPVGDKLYNASVGGKEVLGLSPHVINDLRICRNKFVQVVAKPNGGLLHSG